MRQEIRAALLDTWRTIVQQSPEVSRLLFRRWPAGGRDRYRQPTVLVWVPRLVIPRPAVIPFAAVS